MAANGFGSGSNGTGAAHEVYGLIGITKAMRRQSDLCVCAVRAVHCCVLCVVVCCCVLCVVCCVLCTVVCCVLCVVVCCCVLCDVCCV